MIFLEQLKLESSNFAGR